MKRSKNYRNSAELVDRTKLHAPLEAVRLAKQTTGVKYDATVEVALRLGIDPRRADQMVRGTVNLPHGTGKTARVLVFATGERAEQAKAAGKIKPARIYSDPSLKPPLINPDLDITVPLRRKRLRACFLFARPRQPAPAPAKSRKKR